MMKPTLILLFVLLSVDVKASDLEMSRPLLYLEDKNAYTVFNLSWDNAWNNEKNHDGVWVFFKSLLNGEGYQHIQVLAEGHEVVNLFSNDNLNLAFESSKDGAGLFIFPAKPFRGRVEATVKIRLNPESFANINTRNSSFTAYGIEMVNIPEGSFFAGDPSPEALKHGSFYQPVPTGGSGDFIKIKMEKQELAVSPNGDLHYEAPSGYEGDQKGTVPASYPKGFASFYIMKYEPTEGQYVLFLNSLSETQRVDRVISDEENYALQGGKITNENGQYFTPYPDKPCNFMNWDDAMAFADWAGLRPMTEFEFAKAARGPGQAIAHEFPWNTNSKDEVQRLPDLNGNLTMLNGWNESQLTDDTKAYFGASYYWVMDLSGSLWERVVTLGHPKGRSFKGTHGDGTLSSEGKATNSNWPDGTEESGGIGYRGGGFYGYARAYHQYNPFSPIAFRPYGAWHGGGRTSSYGTRLVRTSK